MARLPANKVTLGQVGGFLAEFMTIDQEIAANCRSGDPAKIQVTNGLVVGQEVAIFNKISDALALVGKRNGPLQCIGSCKQCR